MRIRAWAAAPLALACLVPVVAQAQRVTLNAAEVGRLPKYCWGQHVDPKYAALPGHSIPPACGKAMNHLCPGMMYLIAAQRVADPPRQRRYNAQKAMGELSYTQRHMAPQCPLRAEVQMSMTMAEMLYKTLKR